MSDALGFPFGMDPDALRDAPLFRELQRVMASSSGPINWELARQVGVATALEEGPDPEPTDEDRRMLDEAVRVAELQVAGFTGLELPGDIVHVQPVRRAEWVGASATSLRSLLEPAAQRMGEALETAMREQMPDDVGPMAGMFTQLGPLLQGTQVGQVLGFLATRVLGQYDVAVPRQAGAGALLFVMLQHRALRARLVARPDRVPHLGRHPRGHPSARVRAAVDVHAFRRAAWTISSRRSRWTCARSRSGSRPSTRPTRRRWNGRSAARVATRCSAPCSTTSNG